MVDLQSDAVWRTVSEIYGRSAAFEAETPPEPSWLVPIKINNASIYKAPISPQKQAAPAPNHQQNTAERLTERRGRAVNKCVCVRNGVRKHSVCLE